MQIPLQVTFRHMPPSPALEEIIRKRVEKLDSFYDRVTGCRVMIEAPHQRHAQGKHFHVRIDLTVPGEEIVINRDPPRHASHEDVHVALHDAFDAARRKLQDHVRRVRGQVKHHETTGLSKQGA